MHFFFLFFVVTECTRQQFVESSDYDRHFDTSVLEATYPLKRQVRVPCSIGYAGFFKLTCTENGWKTVGSPCQGTFFPQHFKEEIICNPIF